MITKASTPPKISKKARTRAAAAAAGPNNNSLCKNKIRIFAMLWFVLVAVTLICLLFLFQNVMNYSSPKDSNIGGLLHQINNADRRDSVKDYVQGLLSKNPHLRAKDGHAMNVKEKEQLRLEKAAAIRPEDAETVAFAVSVTGCGSDPLTEGAAVLKHSIHRASIRGTLGGRYNYKMYAIYHPNAIACAKTMEPLGYELLEREVFVKVADIEGEYLRTNIEKNGCCGEKELIKLEAYTLTQHPIVVHLDLDVLVLQPLDDLFDVMMSSTTKAKDAPLDLTQLSLAFPPQEGEPQPTQVNAFFTRDCKLFARCCLCATPRECCRLLRS